ncbi:MAG: ABC transporter permease subunit [Pararobbsia sp.]
MDLFLHYLFLPYLLKGIGFTIAVTVLGLAGGLVVGLVLASMQLSRVGPLAALARGYTVIFRGTPLILQLVFAYDALPHIGLKLSAIGAAGLALAANEGPFIAEILRAGVLGVDRGQVLAGQALGMTPMVLMRRVIAPQAIRTMVPAFGNESVSALKNSSLASVIAVDELTLRSTQLASSTFDFFSIFFASGLIYLVLTGAIAAIQLCVENVLDLDKTASTGRFARLLPWRRAGVAAKAPDTVDGTAGVTEAPEAASAAGAAAAAALASSRRRRQRRRPQHLRPRSSSAAPSPADAGPAPRAPLSKPTQAQRAERYAALESGFPRSRSPACKSATARRTCSTASTSRSVQAKSSRCLARAARARAPCCAVSTISSSGTAARFASADGVSACASTAGR